MRCLCDLRISFFNSLFQRPSPGSNYATTFIIHDILFPFQIDSHASVIKKRRMDEIVDPCACPGNAVHGFDLALVLPAI